jgi:hypothetical protein
MRQLQCARQMGGAAADGPGYSEYGDTAQEFGEREDNADADEPGGEVNLRVVRGAWVRVPTVEALHKRSERGQDQDQSSCELEDATGHLSKD